MFHSTCPSSQYKNPSGPLPPQRRTWRDDHFNAIGECLAGFLGLGMLRPVLPRVRYGGAYIPRSCSNQMEWTSIVGYISKVVIKKKRMRWLIGVASFWKSSRGFRRAMFGSLFDALRVVCLMYSTIPAPKLIHGHLPVHVSPFLSLPLILGAG
jgi:hypothetical protein